MCMYRAFDIAPLVSNVPQKRLDNKCRHRKIPWFVLQNKQRRVQRPKPWDKELIHTYVDVLI